MRTGGGRPSPLARRRALVRIGSVAAAGASLATSSGCAGLATRPGRGGAPEQAASDRRVLEAIRPADFALIGEVHDNAAQHAMRARWIGALARERRFALALEQLDADRQDDLDRALRASSDPRVVAEQAGFEFRGWDWPFYEPYLRIAIERHLPLFAANLSAGEVRRIARGESSGSAPPAHWRPEDEQAMQREIREGHCGMVPESVVPAMAAAQRARDRRMAEALVEARRRTGLPVVLLAGNGHTRADHGVPRHLRELAGDARIVSVGLLESDAASAKVGGVGAPPPRRGASPWNVVVTTPEAARTDPCEAFRARPAR